LPHTIQGSKVYHGGGAISCRQIIVHLVVICRSDRPVAVAVLVGVIMVDIRRPEIYVRMVMMPLGKVVVHHRAEGRCEHGPKSQYTESGRQESLADPC
jgi:hypothetical protein